MKKTRILVAIFVGFIMMLCTNSVQANYQSNNGTKLKQAFSPFLTGVRQMEASGNVMGLEETYNSTTLRSTTNPNNIDVHMVKNTEWGAMAILSASQDYGKKGIGNARYVINDGSNDVNKHTTTGNAYGIYITGEQNWTTGGNAKLAQNADSRYYNIYYSNQTIAGDALLKWHEKDESRWIGGWDDGSYRRGKNGIFSFYGYNYGKTGNFSSRAAIVNGQGF